MRLLGSPATERAARVLVASFCLTVLLATASNLAIEISQADGPSQLLSGTMGERRGLFALGTFIVWIVVVLILGLTGRLWLTAGLVAALTLLVTYANHVKLELRLEPLYPSDLAMAQEAGFLTDVVGAWTVVLVLLAAAVLVALCVAAGRFMSAVFRPIRRADFPRLSRALVATRVLAVGLSLLGLAYIGQFNEPGNMVRATYESRGAHWKWWYQKLNYQANGFVAGVLYNLDVPAMGPAPGYSPEAMDRIVAEYTASAHRTNAGREAGGLEDVNVVLVLSEAFTDPTSLRGLEFEKDPIPFTRDVMSRTTSGAMLAQLYGGGTANMEFEALTGQSLSQFQPQMNAPYQQLLPRHASYPSVVGYFKRLGHKAVAVHPYMTTMYQRDRVYPRLGFDEFVYDETMDSTERLEDSEFISDGAALAEVTRQIKEEETPLFVNLVTMQNHYPMHDIYASPIGVEGADDEDERERAGGYARGLQYSDQALADFLTDLESSEEKTVVVFYGDHQPAIWSKATQKMNSKRTLKETVFFIWSNFGTEQPQSLPTTSPIHFMSHVFETAGADAPPFYALLRELEREIPAMEHGMMVGPDDQLLRPEDLSPRARELLRDYRMVQYDLSVGQRYSEDQLLYGESSSVEATGSP